MVNKNNYRKRSIPSVFQRRANVLNLLVTELTETYFNPPKKAYCKKFNNGNICLSEFISFSIFFEPKISLTLRCVSFWKMETCRERK